MSRHAREPTSRPLARYGWFALALVAVTFLTYAPALRGGWIWDDDYYVTRNITLRSLGGLWRIWTDIGAVPQYYPLTHTTFWVEWRLWGDQPTGYHVANVLLHCANALLVGLILRRLAVPGWWIVPWLFALHPVHVESVAWVTERKNVLSGVFYLLATIAYLRSGFVEKSGFGFRGSGFGRERGPLPSPSSPDTRHPTPDTRFYFLSLALFACALLSKSVTSSLPAVVLLVIYWKRGRITVRDVVPLLPFFALGVGMGMLTSWMERNVVGAQGPEWDFSVADRLLIAGRAVWFYATRLIWPNPLVFMYERWGINDRSLWQYAFPIAALGVVVAMWRLRRPLGRGPLVAALFFGGTLVPALGFVNVLPMRYSFVADHFQYLASLGLIVLFAAAVATYATRAAIAITAVVCLALSIVSWNRAQDFSNIETLWHNTLAKNPSSWMAQNNYGIVLMERGDYESAAERFARAIALKPDHDQARLNLGMVAERQGRLEEAWAWYLDALRVKPGFANAYYNLGRIATMQGKPHEAIGHYERAIASDPTHDEALTNLGILFADRGDAKGAAGLYRRALDVNPYAVRAHLALGNLHLDADRIDEALKAFGMAAALEPSNPVLRNNMGIALAGKGRLDEADREFRASITIRPDYVDGLLNLGILRANRGDVANARQLLTRVLHLDPQNARARQQLDALP